MSTSSLSAGAPPRVGLHRLFWRIHFWAGLVTAPIVLFAACTGLLYVFTPQIEARVHADVDRVPATSATLPLDAQWAAALHAAPGWTARHIVPGHEPGQTTQVLFAAPPSAHAGHAGAEHDHGLPTGRIVYVDPHTAQVVGSLAEMDRFKTWSRKLHSSALQGNGWRWLIELAASWMLVMFATGITMWWPRSRAQGGPGWRALVPRLGRGRASWRDLHTTAGVLMSGLLLVVLVTGLTWSRHAGENFRAAQQALAQASPKLPADLRSQAGPRASLQAVFDAARAEIGTAGGPALPLQIAPPRGADGVWRVDSLVGGEPTRRLTLALDAGSGRVLYRSGWEQLPALAKATAVGIPFHRAEFGAWNQAVLALAALAAIFSVVSGFVMWWQRRPAGRVGAPGITSSQVRAVPLWLWGATLALAFALPVFGISLAVFVGLELAAAASRRARLPSAALWAVVALGLTHNADAQAAEADLKTLERVTVTASRPASMPIEIPTTTESITGKQIDQTINATDAEDALKYFPSLNVRKRYIGDYDHAVLATRASGTGNSARSLVFADGVLLSNLLGNGASYTPRWGLVTPEEIERVDVLYGPFSAAFSGNSAGAVVEYLTRMPKAFEAHVKLQGFSQRQQVYATDDRYNGAAGSASLGSRSGDFAWWLNVSRLDNDGHPIAFANKLVSAGAATTTGTPVTGAVAGRNPGNRDWWILGATNQIHTVQDHAKLKLAYDLSPELRASYTFGYWTNTNERTSESYLRDAAGNPVYGSVANPRVNIDGRDYTLSAADFAPSRGKLEHLAHGLSVKSNTRSTWDVEAAASVYDYQRDEVRAPTTYLPNANAGGAGRITDLRGTGWTTLALKATWRPDGAGGPHTVEAGAQRDAFKLRTRVSNTTDWLSGSADASAPTSFNGDTTLRSVWAQDAWRFAPDWKAVLGLRVEHWNAFNGSISGAPLAARTEADASPKAALSWQATADWVLKASVGRAVRFPTVAELYQGSLVAGVVVNNDPNLKAERSVTTEWTAERDLGRLGLAGSLRTTLFHERTKDALYSQTNVTVTPNVTNIQNVEAIRTHGIEMALQANEAFIKGLDLTSSLTYADSIITKNHKFPASVGQWQPRVPRWRANLLASYAPDEAWSGSLGLRYSGRQYGTLDNSDPNGFSYTGVSSFLVVDVRLQYRLEKRWKLSAGIDNLNNKAYWAFHPYPQRAFHAELRYDH